MSYTSAHPVAAFPTNGSLHHMSSLVFGDGIHQAVAKYAPHLAETSEGEVLFDGNDSSVVSISNEVIVKHGKNVTSAQADTLRYIAQHTDIPVPEVYGFWSDENGEGYLVYKLVHGTTLRTLWPSLLFQEKESIATELANHFRKLHSLQGSYIGKIGRRAPSDKIFEGCDPPGPYETEREMNEAILRAHRSQWGVYGGNPPESFVSTMISWLPVDHDILFSHGDISMSHIIVNAETKKVMAIVGWSMAGFFPEHWDFVNALDSRNWYSDWVKFVPLVLKPYYSEYAVWYRIRRMAFGILYSPCVHDDNTTSGSSSTRYEAIH